MDASSINDVMAKLVQQLATDQELLECARWAAGDRERTDALRESWPTEELPIVADYFCVSCLGRGASGVVFKALAIRGEPEFVALKLLHFGSEEALDRFREREVEILKGLECPHVARYLDAGTTGGAMYLVMELVVGVPLDQYLSKHTVDLEEKLAIFRRVCEVVATVHAEGVIHRDLKPKHVLVDANGQPWIVDFGLSVVRGGDWPTRVRRAQTELGHILGTIKYMSPEQAWGGLVPIDQRADIWSLGIMLYEIATGGGYPYDLEPLDEATGLDALLQRIQTELPKKPRIASRRYADDLGTLLSRCLAYEPKHRLDSAATLAIDLGRCLVQRSIQTRRLPVTYRLQRISAGLAIRSRLSLWLSTIAAVLILAMVLSLWLGVRWPAAGRDFGTDSRRILATWGPHAVRDRIVVIGVFDESVQAVPAWAAAQGISGVTGDPRSWRGLYGLLMERLAQVQPRALIWDCYFRTTQPQDADFVRGVRTLREADVPVVLGAAKCDDNGQPQLSPGLYQPIADSVGHGLVLARDMVARPGEFLMALRRGDRIVPGIAVAAAAAILHPDCRLAIDWQGVDKTIRLVHHPRNGGGRAPAVDPLGLTTVVPDSTPSAGVQVGDVTACRALELNRPAFWEERTIPIERVLASTDEELGALLADRICLVGDLRRPTWFARRDRHRVKYDDGIIEDVPGCYLLADAISALLTNRYQRSLYPLTPEAYLVAVVFASLGCLVPTKLAGRTWLISRRNRHIVLLGLTAGAVACVVVLASVRSWIGVHAAIAGLTACTAMTVSFTIEFARDRRRAGPQGRVERRRLRG